MVPETERPYSIQDLCVLHNLSPATIVKLYENEPEVENTQAALPPRGKCRRYRTLNVPRHVYLRVRAKMRSR
jgi:hypothetical protein